MTGRIKPFPLEEEHKNDLSWLIGNRIKIVLQEAGKTQKEFFEDELGIKRATYTKWISGENKIPIDKLIKIADGLQCTTDFLLCRDYMWKPQEIGIQTTLTHLGYDLQWNWEKDEDQVAITKNGHTWYTTFEELEKETDFILEYVIQRKEEEEND